MATIKKFKNGKIAIKIEKFDIEDGKVNENIYHDKMFMEDLYINQINGYQYIVDMNAQLAYPLYSGGYHLSCYNPLVFILEELFKNQKITLYPLSKKESKSILEDLENGY